MVICVEEMLKWKRVCHTFEAFYFCQSGIFFFAAYTQSSQTYPHRNVTSSLLFHK